MFGREAPSAFYVTGVLRVANAGATGDFKDDAAS